MTGSDEEKYQIGPSKWSIERIYIYIIYTYTYICVYIYICIYIYMDEKSKREGVFGLEIRK